MAGMSAIDIIRMNNSNERVSIYEIGYNTSNFLEIYFIPKII